MLDSLKIYGYIAIFIIIASIGGKVYIYIDGLNNKIAQLKQDKEDLKDEKDELIEKKLVCERNKAIIELTLESQKKECNKFKIDMQKYKESHNSDQIKKEAKKIAEKLIGDKDETMENIKKVSNSLNGFDLNSL